MAEIFIGAEFTIAVSSLNWLFLIWLAGCQKKLIPEDGEEAVMKFLVSLIVRLFLTKVFYISDDRIDSIRKTDQAIVDVIDAIIPPLCHTSADESFERLHLRMCKREQPGMTSRSIVLKIARMFRGLKRGKDVRIGGVLQKLKDDC